MRARPRWVLLGILCAYASGAQLLVNCGSSGSGRGGFAGAGGAAGANGGEGGARTGEGGRASGDSNDSGGASGVGGHSGGGESGDATPDGGVAGATSGGGGGFAGGPQGGNASGECFVCTPGSFRCAAGHRQTCRADTPTGCPAWGDPLPLDRCETSGQLCDPATGDCI